MRAIVERADEVDLVVVDLRGAGQVDAVAASLLADLSDVFAEERLHLAFVDSGDHPALGIELAARDGRPRRSSRTRTSRLEWLEDSLLDEVLGADRPHGVVPLDEHGLCAGLGRKSSHDWSPSCSGGRTPPATRSCTPAMPPTSCSSCWPVT